MPAFSSAPLMTSWLRAQISAGSCSTQPGFGIDLLVLLLVDRDDLPAVVEDHEPGAGGALVEGADVLRHPVPPVLRSRAGQPARPSASRSALSRIVALVAPGSWWPARPLPEVARPALAGDERRDAVAPGRRGRAAAASASARLRLRTPPRMRPRRPGSGRRPWSCRRASPCRARRSRRARPGAAGRSRSARCPRSRRGAVPSSQEERAVERAARATDGGDEGHADLP